MSAAPARPWLRRVRPVLQSEISECGLACIAMAAAHAGHDIDLPGLRRRYPVSAKGSTLAELMEIASDLDLAPRAVRLDLEELPELRLPAVLHWDLNHFVLLERVVPGRATIVDPAMGRRELSREEVSRHFTGVALELVPTPDFKPIEARATIRISDLWSRLQGAGGALAQVVGLSLLLQLTALALPFFLQLTIDEAIAQGDVNLMLLLAIGFGALYLINALTEALRGWVVLTLGESIAYQLAGNVVRHLLRLPLAFFERRHVGDVMSRIGSIRPIQELLTQGMVNAGIDALLALTTLAVMLVISPLLAGIVVAATLAYLSVSLVLFPRWRQRSEEEIVARAQEETHLLETMRAMATIKLAGAETLREAGWRNRYADVVTASYRADRIAIVQRLAENLLFALQLVLVVAFGAAAVIANTLSLGVLLAFLSYRSNFAASAGQLIRQVQDWRIIGLHLERLSDIVGEKQERIGLAPPRPAQLRPPAIAAENLTFAYSPSEPPILEDVSFSIPAGGFAALVGPSGAGKTTLMRLLLGLLEPTDGRILIDGRPLGPGSIAEWRSRIGAVMQDDMLMSGTIADNIASFDPRMDPARVERCARFARVHDEIAAMPMGFQSFIGDMGSALSGGQRQRILLARALYRGPDALFLDEGTANLDEENEEALARSFARYPVTRIVIAHRPALVRHAGLVLEVADRGVRTVPALSMLPAREDMG